MDAAHPLAAPTSVAQRALSIDALRGVAILGILAVNIQYFGLGLEMIAPDPTAADRAAESIVRIVFESKFITIFSLLFGAGIVLMDASALRRDENWTGRFLRRNGILLAIGFVHAYLLWYGDILFTYAVVGFAVFWLRRLDARWLALIGGGMYLVGLLLTGWLWALSGDSGMDMNEEFAAARGSFLERMAYHAFVAAFIQTALLVLFASWFNTGLVLLGMALAKWGVFRGKRPTREYVYALLAAALLALPAITLAALALDGRTLGYVIWGYTNLFFAPILAAGYASAVILLCTRTKLSWIAHPFAAVGRMALSNYILQSVVCVFLFYGGLGGLGWIGEFNNAAILGICFAIFAAQLVISPLWLMVFRFGPLEWLWRSLTYWRPQPMLRDRATPA